MQSNFVKEAMKEIINKYGSIEKVTTGDHITVVENDRVYNTTVIKLVGGGLGFSTKEMDFIKISRKTVNALETEVFKEIERK